MSVTEYRIQYASTRTEGWSSGTYALKDKTGHVVETGKYLSVSKKKDGKWLYVRDTWNSDAPPASTEPGASTKK